MKKPSFARILSLLFLSLEIYKKKYTRLDMLNTGWISEIWKNVQVNIHYTYTASTETNNTSEESPGIQL